MTFCMKCDKIKMNKTVSVRSLIAIGSVDGKYMHSGVPSHAGRRRRGRCAAVCSPVRLQDTGLHDMRLNSGYTRVQLSQPFREVQRRGQRRRADARTDSAKAAGSSGGRRQSPRWRSRCIPEEYSPTKRRSSVSSVTRNGKHAYKKRSFRSDL